ncbi:MAG: dephospho-CoA kinase [Acidimicrobiia bacterium]
MNSRKIGWLLIGGIGSGKSRVRQMLEAAGLPVIDSDQIGHLVLESEARAAVGEAWPEVVRDDNTVDRTRLASIVFSDMAQLRRLEAITHPFIFDRIKRNLQEIEGIAVVEMPIVDPPMDWPKIVVDAEDEVRMRRVLDRGLTPEAAEARFGSQPTRGAWLAAADVVIPNHGSIEELQEAVTSLVPFLRS